MKDYITGFDDGDGFVEFTGDDFEDYTEALAYCEQHCKQNGRSYYILAPISVIERSPEVTTTNYNYS